MFWVDVSFEWWEDAIKLNFLFRTRGRMDTCMKANTATVIVVFPKVPYSKCYLITALFKGPLQ